jgi:hypothetical protein
MTGCGVSPTLLKGTMRLGAMAEDSLCTSRSYVIGALTHGASQKASLQPGLVVVGR